MRPDASVVIVICAVCGSTSIRARTTFVPKLNGPATTGVTIDSPNGAPPTAPSSRSGSAARSAEGYRTGTDPGPAPTTVCPICEAAGHVPSLACVFPTERDGGDHPGETLGRLERQAREALLTITTRKQHREVGIATRLVGRRARRQGSARTEGFVHALPPGPAVIANSVESNASATNGALQGVNDVVVE